MLITIAETRQTIPEIDKAIDSQGGYPDAFVQGNHDIPAVVASVVVGEARGQQLSPIIIRHLVKACTTSEGAV